MEPGISTPCSFLKHQHLSSIGLTLSSQRRRQLNHLTSQVKTLNLSTPGGSSYNNLLVFPVLIPDYFAAIKSVKLFLLSVLYVGQIYTENDKYICHVQLMGLRQ
ncbi:hypothetical protein ATANTOWER_031560, partial [Ataeniobius toweri]|nr:hypothetical protein [Ataeniobius toweri]